MVAIVDVVVVVKVTQHYIELSFKMRALDSPRRKTSSGDEENAFNY